MSGPQEQKADDCQPDDFARLFRVPGVGQVLAYVGMNDDGDPALIIRIPDSAFASCALTLSMKEMDEGKGTEIAQTALHGLTPEGIANTIQPMMEAQRRLSELEGWLGFKDEQG